MRYLLRRLLTYRYSQSQADQLRAVMGLPNVVFVLGGPGAGKGTQCAKIVQEFGYVHLSAGDLLRAERNKPGSEVGALIEHHITGGTIVPVAITCSLLEKAMLDHMAENSKKNNFLIDGFPRNEDNLQGWESQMNGKHKLKFILFFDCDDKICVDRCLARGQAGSGRTDDNLASLTKRIETYNACTRPIIEFYNKQGLVRTINAAGSPDTIFDTVKSHFAAIGN